MNSNKRQVSKPKKPVKPAANAASRALTTKLPTWTLVIIAERQEKSVPKYLLRWEGFGPEDDTWEPIENLAGAEEYISRFVEERNAAAPSDLRMKMRQNELRYVNVQSNNHLNLLMMYLWDLVLSLENLRLLNVKLHA